LAQYNNALYVLDADAANPGDVYIYDFAAGTCVNTEQLLPKLIRSLSSYDCWNF